MFKFKNNNCNQIKMEVVTIKSLSLRDKSQNFNVRSSLTFCLTFNTLSQHKKMGMGDEYLIKVIYSRYLLMLN